MNLDDARQVSYLGQSPPPQPAPLQLVPPQRQPDPRWIKLNNIYILFTIAQTVLAIIIFSLEVSSLSISTDSFYKPTACGIWCSVIFATSILLTISYHDEPRVAAISQGVLICFSIIMIGIDGNFVQNGGYYSNYLSSLNSTAIYSFTKYRIIQAQLGFAIIMMVTGPIGITLSLAKWQVSSLSVQIVQIMLTIIIFSLEISSLSISIESFYKPTACGIWCSIMFVINIILSIYFSKFML
ncbi:unnamed protein product [Didymodactylos carnosus]|uniref:Uncharacterized protein n=1 Tax=Didymodactylos carnosus TaxID=1234261 RepID=A0A815SL72_9BILA|nr:unnamed protein product [Didymodactylos carnosus]CAF1490342.1 unnamed protein product [Didymodactylos carnosus]CAF4151664.1 unnamed protein product [Didymodactylos carnosus]CAF4353413.1 unnamed protein product [Didymodactylos carnosus]